MDDPVFLLKYLLLRLEQLFLEYLTTLFGTNIDNFFKIRLY